LKHWNESQSLRVKCVLLAVALLPAGLFIALLQGPMLALASKRLDRQAELKALRANVYRQDWLDSANASLRLEVETLRDFHRQIRRALSPETRDEAISDPLRRGAQAAGCEVLRLSASRDSAGGLRRLRMRLEGRGDFDALLRLFRDWRENHPEVYVDEALIRKASGGGQKLTLQISLAVHLDSPGLAP
jgi:hypothetical protein